MRLKTMLLAGGATLLMAGAASAGALIVTVENVNNGASVSAANVEMDSDEIAVPTFPDTDFVTIEDDGLVLSETRDFAGSKFMPGHFEVNVRDTVPTLNIVPGNVNYDITINLQGNSNPEWKEAVSPARLVRAGTDRVSSQGAFGPQTVIGGNTVTFNLDAADVGETAVGFVLPVRLQQCGDFIVEIVISERGNPSNRRAASTQVAECGDDATFIANFVSPKDLKVEYDLEDPFERFLVPDGRTGKGLTTSPYDAFGVIDMKVKNVLFTLKAKTNNPARRYVDATEIESYTIRFDFKDDTGLDGISLVPETGKTCPTGLFRPSVVVPNAIQITLTGAQAIACFGLSGSDAGEAIARGGVQKGSVMLRLHSNELFPIKTQDVSVGRNEFVFVEAPGFGTAPSGDPSPNAMLSSINVEANTPDDALRIVRNGLNFGPFDWATAEGRPVQSYFRVSGLPALEARDQHGNLVRGTVAGLTAYRGSLLIDHSSKGVKGACEFDLTSQISDGHGEMIISPPIVTQILNGDFGHCAGSANIADFQRGDFTWTWFVPEANSQETDMDRLLVTGGVFADYGDNGNDAFSLKARSCDVGRFGPHVANNLSGGAADFLTAICSAGGI